MQCVRWGNIQAKKLAKMLSCSRTCLITCTWSFSEPRGTSTSLASLSFSGCESFCSYTDSPMTKQLISNENKLATELALSLGWGISPAAVIFLSFCRVMKRVVTLINQLASAGATTAALQTQADSANKTAKKYMEDNELLKQVGSTLVWSSHYC